MNLSIEDILFLREVNGLGTQRLRLMVESGLNIQEILKWKENDWARIKGLNPQLSYSDFHKKYSNKQLRQNILESIKHADQVLTIWNNDYPEFLRFSPSPPLVLFIKGTSIPLQKQLFAIVGTRSPSAYGKFYSRMFSEQLIETGFKLLSGFARGVDTIVHHTSVKKKSETLAVLGSGLNVIYPRENKTLYNQILENNGTIISEFLYNTKPDAVNFPKRNRIIASLTTSLLVIEAGEKSGAIITANMAISQKKNVFAIPGNIDSKQSIGTNLLIKNGAILTRDITDIKKVLKLEENQKSKQLSFLDFSKSEEKILDILSAEPIYIDKIAEKLYKQPFELLPDLLNLEIKQCIRKLEGNYFVKTL